MADLSKTLEQLEEDCWGDPGEYSTPLVETVYALRRKPLREFTIENLRIILGQNFSVPLLLPLALDVLERQPLAEGDCYPGDLLEIVMNLKPDALAQVVPLLPRLEALAHSSLTLVASHKPRSVRRAVERFLSSAAT